MSSSAFKTIIIDDFHPVLLEKLDEGDIPYHYLPEISGEEALKAIVNYDIIVVRSKVNFTSAVIENLPALKCIARGGAGMDNIDELSAGKNNVILLNAPEGNRDAVAEHTIGLMLALSNKIVKANNEVRNGIWQREDNRGFEIGGKTIGIIGYGNTGRALAKKLSGFGCRLIAYDKYHASNDSEVEAVDLRELQLQSDIISLHIPLTNETRKMIDGDFLSHCKKDLMLLNTSRGQIVDQNAILNAFKSGALGSFGADVLWNENLRSFSFPEKEIFEALVNLPFVIITPHVAGWTTQSYMRIAQVLAGKLIDFTTK